MAVPWRATLPTCVDKTTWSEKLGENLDRTSFETGDNLQIRKSVAGPRNINFGFVMTRAQLIEFEDFFENDIAFGALSFTFINPRTSVANDYRILGEPQKSIISFDIYQVSFQAEQLP